MRSNLKNIFVAALFNTKDVKTIGNNKTFFKLIEQLNDLESNGVQLNLPGRNIKIFFSLGLVVGDNLSVNSVLGFSKSFSANFFCRFCHSNKINTGTLTTEITSSLRNKCNYEEDVIKNDYKLTGIHENSIFNSVNSFHVVENFAVDLMHDIFEGICVYDMSHIILNLIKSEYFNLETLNNRKQYFQYGETEIGNISPLLKMVNLNHKNFKMSAREMQSFVHFFPLIIGDLVPENDQTWKFLVNLVEMIDLLLSSIFDNNTLTQLQKSIEYHNLKYVELFNDNLKPKHHFLTHYYNIIKKSGPLKYVWSFSFESKHKQLKLYTKNTNSRINIPISLGIKFSMNFSEFLLNFNINTLINNYTFVGKGSPLINYEYFKKITSLCPNEYKHLLDSSIGFSKMMHFNKIYSNKSVLITYENDLTVYMLQQIIRIDENTILIFCQKMDVICYVKHLTSFKISKIIKNDYVLKNINCFKGPPIHLYDIPNNTDVYFIRLKHF